MKRFVKCAFFSSLYKCKFREIYSHAYAVGQYPYKLKKKFHKKGFTKHKKIWKPVFYNSRHLRTKFPRKVPRSRRTNAIYTRASPPDSKSSRHHCSICKLVRQIPPICCAYPCDMKTKTDKCKEREHSLCWMQHGLYTVMFKKTVLETGIFFVIFWNAH